MGAIERSAKGRKIFDEGKVKVEINTDKRTHFQVSGDTEEHTVVFDKTKKSWGCDCKFSSLKNKDCSHIIACKISTNRL